MNIARIANVPTTPTPVKVVPTPQSILTSGPTRSGGLGPTRTPPVDVRVVADPGYAAAIAKWQAWQAAEKQLPLQTGSETRTYIHPEKPAKGTLIMYHGYTAGTWQFDLLAKQAYNDGYNVVIPRLPGHGMKDAKGVEDPSKLLTAKDWQQYESFGDQTYAMAQGLGGPISTLGLSVGGNIAMSVAERHPVGKVVAYAPFLKPIGIGGKIADVVHVLDKFTFGLAGRALALVPWGWGKETEAETASGKRPGHSKFSLGTLYGAAEFGRRVTGDAAKIKAPIEYFTTGADDAADEGTIHKAFLAEGGDDGWYHYPTAEGVPHPMVHPQEDKGKGQTPELYKLTMQFLDSGKVINRN
ncbi:MAG: alpha/beta hydrolase [Cyanobacteria bacterium RYN_339]|nr:alpha/beta hydrolase [Cyanobacteria bacterium RYN_339]